jgi:hypothetical protein
MLDTISAQAAHPLRFLLEPHPARPGKMRFKQPPLKLSNRGRLIPDRSHHMLLGKSEDDLSQPRAGQDHDPEPWYVEAGHRTTNASGAPEFLGLQDAHENQLQGKFEAPKHGHIFDRTFVDVGGVPVEWRTALQWTREINPATGRPLLDPSAINGVHPGWDVANPPVP